MNLAIVWSLSEYCWTEWKLPLIGADGIGCAVLPYLFLLPKKYSCSLQRKITQWNIILPPGYSKYSAREILLYSFEGLPLPYYCTYLRDRAKCSTKRNLFFLPLLVEYYFCNNSYHYYRIVNLSWLENPCYSGFPTGIAKTGQKGRPFHPESGTRDKRGHFIPVGNQRG